MPVIKVSGGYKVEGAKTVFKTRKEAEQQMKAIYASKAKKGKRK